MKGSPCESIASCAPRRSLPMEIQCNENQSPLNCYSTAYHADARCERFSKRHQYEKISKTRRNRKARRNSDLGSIEEVPVWNLELEPGIERVQRLICFSCEISRNFFKNSKSHFRFYTERNVRTTLICQIGASNHSDK